MNKLFISFVLLSFSVALTACGGNDEPIPEKTDEITRVQDGNGKVFLENGVLVAANIDYTAAELNEALTGHEWYFDYGFYYDNHNVSPKMDLSRSFPTNIHVDGTIEYQNYPIEEGRVRDYSINGKEMTVKFRQDNIASSLYIPNSTFIIIALDMNNGDGRIIMDHQSLTAPLEGYDENSSFARSIWRTTPNN